VGLKWWLAATVVQPLLLVVSALVFNQLGGDPKITVSSQASVGGFFFIVFFLLVAVLGEEIGWHGVGLPALQQKNTALKASMILGFLWGIWHLPFWLLLDSFNQYGVGYIGMNLLLVLPLTFYSTWFFNHARFSILLPVAFHLIFNIVNTALLPVTIVIGAFWILIVFEWAISLPLLNHLETNPLKSLASAI
jgi:membrane protease YdiL (CAAX protease family)